MSNQNYRQEIIEEAEFLRKRTWDFIAKLEKLEIEQKNSTNLSNRKKLKVRIDNTRRLLDDYKIQYKNICKEAGIRQDNLSITAPARDVVSLTSKKTEKAHEDLLNGEYIDLPPFFVGVHDRNPKFTGREEEVRSFIKRVLKGGAFSICGVKGMGGIGKTEIAKEVCHLFHETWKKDPKLPEYIADIFTSDKKEVFFRDGILWIEFEPEKQTPKILSNFIIPKLADDPRITAKISDFDILAKILKDKDVLVVLDSVEQNLQTFDYVLERFKGKFPIIITSRIAIPGIHAFDIDVLTEEEAESLFISNLNNPDKLSDDNNKTIKELCRILGNYPLILERIAALVNDENSNLEELKEEYKKKKVSLLKASTENTEIDSRHADVSTCFMMSFNSLGDIEKEAFLHSSLFNNPFTTPALANLVRNENETEVQQIITHLLHKSLISQTKTRNKEEQVTTTYYLHPLMREFALDLLMKKVELNDDKKEKITELLQFLQKKKTESTLLEQLKNNQNILQQVTEAMEYSDKVFDFSTVLEIMKIVDNAIEKIGLWKEKIYLNKLAIRSSIGLQQQSSELTWHIQLSAIITRKAVFKVDFENARKAWNNALSLNQNKKNKEYYLFSLYVLSHIEKELHRWNTSFFMCNQGIRESCIYLNYAELGSHLRVIGDILEEFKDKKSIYFRALNYKIRTLKYKITNDSDKTNILRAYGDIVESIKVNGRIKNSIAYYKQLLEFSYSSSIEMTLLIINELFHCYLYLQDKELCSIYLKYYQELHLNVDSSKITLRKNTGKLAWLNKDYNTAIQLFKSSLTVDDLNKYEYHYWLGKTYLYMGELNKAKKYLNSALDYYIKQNNPVKIANTYSLIALLLLKLKKTLDAVQVFNSSLKTLQKYNIKSSPEEEQIKLSIYNQFLEEGGNKQQYAQLVNQANMIDFYPDFILPELNETYKAKDSKIMKLIPAGSVFIGKGAIETLSSEELLNNIEQYIYPYQQHSKQYKLPEHPDSNFDEDKLLFLLEHNKTMSTEEKQEVVDNIAKANEVEIHALIQKLEKEYKQTNLKATEIYLYDFYMDRDPVSNTEYQTFCIDTKHSFPSHWPGENIPENTEDLPVVNITLKDAKEYAKWANKKIPTAAEWEKACRGEDGNAYPWGNDWNEKKVIVKDGSVRKQFDDDYLELNAVIPDTGGMIHFPSPRFKIPKHKLKFNEELFLGLLEGSISLTTDEKTRVIASIPQLTQFQVDELIRILSEEKEKFSALDKKHDEQMNYLRKKFYMSLMQPELHNLYKESVKNSIKNESIYGIRNLVGCINHLTVTESNNGFVVKGGSWFSNEPEKDCSAWAEEIIDTSDGIKKEAIMGGGTSSLGNEDRKRMDIGFRCVKPIFGKDDLEDEMLA